MAGRVQEGFCYQIVVQVPAYSLLVTAMTGADKSAVGAINRPLQPSGMMGADKLAPTDGRMILFICMIGPYGLPGGRVRAALYYLKKALGYGYTQGPVSTSRH